MLPSAANISQAARQQDPGAFYKPTWDKDLEVHDPSSYGSHAITAVTTFYFK
jgi:hypothetical protein